MHVVIKGDVWAVRSMASEGQYHLYRQLFQGRRLFISLKLASTAFRYWYGKGHSVDSRHIAFIKGSNQERHHKYTEAMRSVRIGPLESFSNDPSSGNSKRFPRIRTREFIVLLSLALLILLFARRRTLSMFLLIFYKSAQRIISNDLEDVEVFLCYNDQPFDVAAFVYGLAHHNDCRTIAIQHGLILSPKFYFPTNSREFWAWGELSREHFTSRHCRGRIEITGRYDDDIHHYRPSYVPLQERQMIKALIAFSFKAEEIIYGIKTLDRIRTSDSSDFFSKLEFFLKFHPSTKNMKKILFSIRSHLSWIKVVYDDMEILSERNDILVTLNSSSAIDFLLRGKRVFFVDIRNDNVFPSHHHGFPLSKINDPEVYNCDEYNKIRRRFLSYALNINTSERGINIP